MLSARRASLGFALWRRWIAVFMMSATEFEHSEADQRRSAIDETTKGARLTFLFRAGRRSRLAATGAMPTEFFYGYTQLKTKGVDVRYLEDADIGIAPPLPLPARLLNKASFLCGDLPVGMMLALSMCANRRRLDDAGTVIATTNNMGLTLAFGKAFGLVRAPVLLLAMGLLRQSPSRLKRFMYGWLLRRLHVVCIATAEREFLQRLFPQQSIEYVPFGVDAEFWWPSVRPDDGYVLAIGNDYNRDWKTLVSSWSSNFPPLKIVTTLPVPAGPANIEVIRGDWRSQLLSDEAVRKIYQGARFVIVPLRETIQPAGQSVCLQAMACGKAVIVSDIAGLWNRELMVDGQTVLLTPPGDVSGLRDRVRALIDDGALVERLGSAGRELVESRLNTNVMAEALTALAVQGEA